DAFQSLPELSSHCSGGAGGKDDRRKQGRHVEEILLRPMPPERFPQIIAGPARRKGLTVGPELVSRMSIETGTGTALPLLAFTLREMAGECEKASNPALSMEAYDKLAGIKGAVKNVAERIEKEIRLSPGEWQELRPLFVRLAKVDAEGRFVRQAAVW